MAVTRDEIAWVYRAMLGREAREQELAVWEAAAPTLEGLREACVTSAEFGRFLELNGRKPAVAAPAPRLGLDLPPSRVDWDVAPDLQARLIAHVTNTWTLLGREKPHWSVLSANDFMPERIEENRQRFYASGSSDVAGILSALARHGRRPEALPRMVEYGCGVGRVTPHLAGRFQSVTAIDISESHLGLAMEAVRGSGAANVRFNLARAPDFGMTEPFDLWFSFIVLQHNPPPIMALVLRRALTMLRPGGVAIFQVPAYATGYRFAIEEYLAAPTDTGTIEVHCLPQPVVFAIAAACGCVPLEVREDTAMGPPSAWLSNRYVFTKPG